MRPGGEKRMATPDFDGTVTVSADGPDDPSVRALLANQDGLGTGGADRSARSSGSVCLAGQRARRARNSSLGGLS